MSRIFLVIIAVVLVGAGIWFFLMHSSNNAVITFPESASSTPTVSTAPLVRDVPSGFDEYHDAAYHFSLIYPNSLAASKRDGGGGATFTFEDDKSIVGFQIFAVLFEGKQITEERFKEDIPSGIRKNLKNITVDGAVGAAFYSQDHLLGDTYEVWFLHDGYLYEITTFKELDSWLDDILKTWKFF